MADVVQRSGRSSGGALALVLILVTASGFPVAAGDVPAIAERPWPDVPPRPHLQVPDPPARPVAPLPDPEPTASHCTAHPPIRIMENVGPQGFVLGRIPITGEPIYRPGSGVVDGLGTPEEPYIIGGWCIVLTGTLGLSAIRIDGTTAHVRVMNNTISALGWQSSSPGIHLHNARNVTLEGNILPSRELRITSSMQVLAKGNRIFLTDQAVSITSSKAVTLRQNDLTSVRIGVMVMESSDVAITGNGIIAATHGGIQLADVANVRLERNHLHDARIVVDRAVGLEIHGNTIIESWEHGVWLSGTTGARLSGNRIESPWPVLAEGGTGTEVWENEVRFIPAGWIEAGAGIVLDNENAPVVHRNNVIDAWAGIALISVQSGTITQNNLTGSYFYLEGRTEEQYIHVVEDNQIDGRPLWYVRNRAAVEAPADAAQVILIGVDGARLENLSIVGAIFATLVLYSSDVVIANSHFESNLAAVVASDSRRLEVRDNTLSDNIFAVALFDVAGAHVTQNAVHSNGYAVIGSGSEVIVEHNELQDGWVGVLISGASSTAGASHVRANDITGFEVGVLLFGRPAGVHWNNIHGNHEGLSTYDIEGLADARHNWWGCPAGPGEPGCDAAAGDVLTDPWLIAPNPDAGRE